MMLPKIGLLSSCVPFERRPVGICLEELLLFRPFWYNFFKITLFPKKENFVIKSLALFPTSMNPEKLEELLSKQVASMKSAKGLQSLTTSEDHLMSPGGPPAYSKVLESSWESIEDFLAWVGSQKPEDQADKNFMLDNGAVLLYFEVKEL
jgi:hypothetical protein